MNGLASRFEMRPRDGVVCRTEYSVLYACVNLHASDLAPRASNTWRQNGVAFYSHDRHVQPITRAWLPLEFITPEMVKAHQNGTRHGES